MLHKTRGIVFNSSEYGETSLVVQIYTELFGIQSYIINGVRKKHAKHHSNVFQRLTPVDLVVYHKERPGLQRISDIRPNPPLATIPFNVLKSSVVFFIDEILYKSIREEESNPPLFDFIFESIQWLDHSQHAPKNFHLIFMILLSRFLGFSPTRNYSAGQTIFNLKDGHFQHSFPIHPHFIPPEHSFVFNKLLSANYSSEIEITNEERRLMINYLIEFYALHIEGFGAVKSHKVLEQVWE
jgi:DNA repair protein RecO (recombination protein O)